MCWKCKNPIDSSERIYRDSTCNFCKSDLHCCKNCKFFSAGSHYDCKEDIDEQIIDKEKSNFCDWFAAKTNFDEPHENTQNARKAFDALFGD